MKLLLLSGGMDSTVLFYDLISNEERFQCVWIDYGQKNAREEQKVVEELCLKNLITLTKIFVPLVFEGVSSTLLKNVEGEHTVGSDEIVNRNAVLISIAAAHCPRDEITTILVGAHKTEAAYADATKIFYQRMCRTISWSTSGKVYVEAPYITKTKKGIAKRAWDLGLSPNELLGSVSCYDGNNCGKCPACKARKQALEGTPYWDFVKS